MRKTTTTIVKTQDFYRELEQLLRRQLQEDPAAHTVRLRLIELYFEQQRPADFLREARAMHAQLRSPGGSRDWQRVFGMGRTLAPTDPLFAGQSTEFVQFRPTTMRLQAPAQVRRFADEPEYAPHFAALGVRWEKARADRRFLAELELLSVGPTRRPTPLVPAKRLSDRAGGARILVKREDLAGEHPHLTLAVTGQALLAKWTSCGTLVVGTADGRRGVVTASLAARLGLKALVFMDAEAAERHATAVTFMKLMGADVRQVRAQELPNRDLRQAALNHWAAHPDTTFLITGLDAAPPPYPAITQESVASIGRELRRQMAGRLPDVVITRGAGTADALGVFPAFLSDSGTRLVCVEPEEEAEPESGRARQRDPWNTQSIPLTSSEKKVARNILDRLEYPSVAREHALLRASRRVDYVTTRTPAARRALQDYARCEGVVASIETAHVLAWAIGEAGQRPADEQVVAVMHGTGDRDAWEIGEMVASR